MITSTHIRFRMSAWVSRGTWTLQVTDQERKNRLWDRLVVSSDAAERDSMVLFPRGILTLERQTLD